MISLAPSPLAPPLNLWRRLVQHALLVSAVLLLVPLTSNALPMLYKDEVLPFKPRDYKLFFTVLTLLLVMLNRPAFCLPALALLIVPLARFLDAAVLQRFLTETYFENHETYVLNLGSDLLVTLVAILCLCTPIGRRTALVVVFGTAVVAVVSIAYEYAGYAEWTNIPGRVSGLLGDANGPGIVLSLCIGVVLTLSSRFWWNMGFIAFCGVGNALTLSRSGTIGIAIITVCYILANLKQRAGSLLLIAIVAVPLAGIGVAMLGADTERKGVIRDDNAKSRVEAIYELDFEKLWSGERAKDLLDGWEAVTQSPITGHGTGAGTFWWRPHNEVVSLWVDLGILGPTLYCSMLGYLIWRCARTRLRGLYCLVPVCFFIPFSQVLVELPSYWITAAVAALVTSPKRYRIALALPARRRSLPSPSGTSYA
jgi:O-antigen ligase/polysaccharide polymerase Wzy-like membrane protein